MKRFLWVIFLSSAAICSERFSSEIFYHFETPLNWDISEFVSNDSNYASFLCTNPEFPAKIRISAFRLNYSSEAFWYASDIILSRLYDNWNDSSTFFLMRNDLEAVDGNFGKKFNEMGFFSGDSAIVIKTKTHWETVLVCEWVTTKNDQILNGTIYDEVYFQLKFFNEWAMIKRKIVQKSKNFVHNSTGYFLLNGRKCTAKLNKGSFLKFYEKGNNNVHDDK